jgi:hypothetical protein
MVALSRLLDELSVDHSGADTRFSNDRRQERIGVRMHSAGVQNLKEKRIGAESKRCAEKCAQLPERSFKFDKCVLIRESASVVLSSYRQCLFIVISISFLERERNASKALHHQKEGQEIADNIVSLSCDFNRPPPSPSH